MPRVSNGNLIVLKWQNIHMISNTKYTAVYFNSAEAYSEPFPKSKPGRYLIGGNYFHKKLYLRCLKRF